MRTLLTIGTILILTTSCHQKFDKEKWNTQEDLRTYPFRESMLSDILENKKLIGLPCRQILDSLGQPNAIENGQIYYSSNIEYGTDIDPVYFKDLVFTFDKDSIVTDIKIKEWKK
jgi:hypothetical protein